MKYRYMWGQKQSAMIAEIHILNFAEYNNELNLAKGITDVIREHNKGASYLYFSEKSIEDMSVNGKIFLNKQKAKVILNKINKMPREFMRFLLNLKKLDYFGLTNKKIIELINQYRRYMIFMQKLFRASEPSGTKILEDKIKNILAKRYKENDLIENFTTLLTSTRLDKTQQELVDWLNLLSSSKKITDKVLLEHALGYPANYANTWSYQEIITYLKRRRSHTNLDELKSEVTRIKEFKSEIRRKQNIIYEEFKNEKNLHYYSKTLQELAVTRFYVKHAWAGAEILCLDFLKRLAKIVKIDFKIFMASYNFTDIFNYFKKNKKLSKAEIKNRIDYSIIHYKNNKFIYFYGQKAKNYFNKLYNIKTAHKKLTGMIANKGRVRGHVRIVKVEDLKRFIEDTKIFQKGEILVTTMTSPIMISLASKAGAIVTNEGGMLSHAAVMSRELNMPCIVGTHDATNIFENGDLVEVDANKGVIQQIE